MKLCAICHEEVHPNEEIKIKGVPYHTYCYEEDFIDEISSTGGSVGYSGSAFADEEDEEILRKEIKNTIDEMSTTSGISGFSLPLGQKSWDTIKDPYKNDKKKDPPVDDSSEIKNKLATGQSGYKKIHPINKQKNILNINEMAGGDSDFTKLRQTSPIENAMPIMKKFFKIVSSNNKAICITSATGSKLTKELVTKQLEKVGISPSEISEFSDRICIFFNN